MTAKSVSVTDQLNLVIHRRLLERGQGKWPVVVGRSRCTSWRTGGGDVLRAAAHAQNAHTHSARAAQRCRRGWARILARTGVSWRPRCACSRRCPVSLGRQIAQDRGDLGLGHPRPRGAQCCSHPSRPLARVERDGHRDPLAQRVGHNRVEPAEGGRVERRARCSAPGPDLSRSSWPRQGRLAGREFGGHPKPAAGRRGGPQHPRGLPLDDLVVSRASSSDPDSRPANHSRIHLAITTS